MFPNFEMPIEGKLRSYSAVFIFAIGVFLSNIIFNFPIMVKPFVGKPLAFAEYFKGSLRNHLLGILVGSIRCIGMCFSIIASVKAGTAISFGLTSGQLL